MVYVIYCWLWVRKARKTPTFAESFKQGTATDPPFLLCSANTQSLHSWSLHNSVVPFSTSVLTALERSVLPPAYLSASIINWSLHTHCHLTLQRSKQNTVEDNHNKVKKKKKKTVFTASPLLEESACSFKMKFLGKTFSCHFQDRNCFFLPFWQIKLLRSCCCLNNR